MRKCRYLALGVVLAAGNTNYKAVDGILYSSDGKEMLAVPRNKAFENGVYEIPEGVTTWNYEAMWADFENNSASTLADLLVNCPGVSIPESMTVISSGTIKTKEWRLLNNHVIHGRHTVGR